MFDTFRITQEPQGNKMIHDLKLPTSPRRRVAVELAELHMLGQPSRIVPVLVEHGRDRDREDER